MEVMSGGGTIDAVVYIYSDGVCEFDINKYDSTGGIKVTDQSDDEYGLMIDNYVDAIRKFGEMKEGDIVANSDMIRSLSFQNAGTPTQNVKEEETRAQPENTEDNGKAGAQPENTEDNGKAGAQPENTEDNGKAGAQPGLQEAEAKAAKAVEAAKEEEAEAVTVNKKNYDQVKTYLETIPNTYTMYDLLTCKWISILNNEISPIAVDKIGDLKDTIYNPVLNAFYKKNANTTSLNHNVIKKNETQDNIRFSHFEEFWECNNTSKKWIYGRWINGTEYKFKYDNGWLIA